jgi:hypothetical protein
MANDLIKAQTGVLQKIGSPEERSYLLQVMAESLGLPGDRIEGDPKLMAVLANAVQRTIKYGWVPGIHMHVQSFKTRDGEIVYTLVDGEKSWKDSGARWRIVYGVNWRYQRKPMTKEEIYEEARLANVPRDQIKANCYGMWSRILMPDDNQADPDNPIWSAGLFLGTYRMGQYFKDETIPVGVSARDIAIRRADKRAMMQSPLTLLPVDDRAEAQRIADLTDNLRNEYVQWKRQEGAIHTQVHYQVEEDGEVLYAASSAARGQDIDVTVTAINVEPDQDVDFYAELAGQEDFAPPVRAFIDQMRQLDQAATRPMTKTEYGYLVKLINGRCNAPLADQVLTCLMGRTVNASNPVGYELRVMADYIRNTEQYAAESAALDIIAASCATLQVEMETPD